MNTIDTRDLIEERENTQQRILDDFNEKFNQDLEDYLEIDSFLEDFEYETDDQNGFLEYWEDELNEIQEINDLEDEVGSEWEYGVTLIDEDDFVDFVEQDLEDCGYISKDFPVWIEIDWEATANNVRRDYQEVEFRGTNYLFI
jgi:Rad3-related DNA helicase